MIDTHQIKVERLSSIKEISLLTKQWDELEDLCPDKHVLLDHKWVLNWFHCFGNNKQIYFLKVSCADELLALMPLVLSHGKELFPARDSRFSLVDDYEYLPAPKWLKIVPIRRITFPININSYNARSHILYNGDIDAICHAIFEYLADNSKDWDILSLEGYPTDSPMWNEIYRAASLSGLSPLSSGRQQTLYKVDLHGSFEDYLQNRSSHFRKRFKASVRKCQSLGQIDVQEYSGETIETGLALLYDLEKKSWKVKTERKRELVLTLNNLSKPFLNNVGLEYAKQDAAHIYIMSFNDIPISGLFTLSRQSTTLTLLIYFDDEFRKQLTTAPLWKYFIEHCIIRGIKTIDFQGNTLNAQKYSNGSDHYQRIYIFNSQPYSKILCHLKSRATWLSCKLKNLKSNFIGN